MIRLNVTNDASQSDSFTFENVAYNYNLIFNTRSCLWSISIYDNDFNPIVEGVALVGGSNVVRGLNTPFGSIRILNTIDGSIEVNTVNIDTDGAILISTESEEAAFNV